MDRQIYKWHDGIKDRLSDPMVLKRRFHRVLKDTGIDISGARCDIEMAQISHELTGLPQDPQERRKQIQEDVWQGYESSGDIAKVAYFMFDVKPVADDGTGLTEDEATKLFTDFFAWEGEVMGEANGSPTTPVSTEQRASISTGEKSTDSTSTLVESTAVEQPSQPSVASAPTTQPARR